jgi:hypothetical protein
MNIHHIALITGLFLSGVAAYYSVVGIASIFASGFIPVVIMGVALEAAKVVATSWLFRNWGTAPRLIKTYLIVAIVVLMLLLAWAYLDSFLKLILIKHYQQVHRAVN